MHWDRVPCHSSSEPFWAMTAVAQKESQEENSGKWEVPLTQRNAAPAIVTTPGATLLPGSLASCLPPLFQNSCKPQKDEGACQGIGRRGLWGIEP